jgi:hypothetical protein
VLGGALAIVLVAVLLGTATVLLLFPGAHGPYGEPEGGTHASGQEGDLPEDTSAFRGVNWADPRDNYASDELVLSGLTSDMTPQEVTDASTTILTGFEDLLGANTVRIPINPATVTDPWWESYRATIDTARAQGMTVILSYWEADDQKDGFIDDEDAYNAMWDTVIETYAEDEGVYVEPMNEPFGYSPEDWVTTATRFVQTYEEDIPRSRIIVSGSGYNDDVTVVGAAPDLEGTLLSLHFYGFWNDHTSYDAWYEDLQPRIGEYGPRTLISEAGSPMSVGLNYWGALTDTAREQDMGIVYWPGLRTGDSYSMTRQGDDGSLEVSSETGLALLRWGWGLEDTKPQDTEPAAPAGEPITLQADGRCLEVSGEASDPGSAVGLWECSGGVHQSWDLRDDGTVHIYDDMCLARKDADGTLRPMIEACTGAEGQQWDLFEDGSLATADDPALTLRVGTDTDGGEVLVVSDAGEEAHWAVG